MPRTALFLDRDGTLIRHIHYLHDPAGVELLPGAAAALARARQLGHLLFLHTNQSGVGRGMFPLEAAHACNQRMLELLGLGDDVFTSICVAPEAPGQSVVYRKPSPRFAQEMAARHNLDLPRCWMIGDYPADVETAFAAGMQAIALEGGDIDGPKLAAWRKAGREVTAYPSLAEFVKTLGTA
ncbi:MAG TPA: HAD-IIIA family hydrolase [Opitutales bacterium]|nr:HAD-IIIA family hydrolase [Opitutales bacterium]